MDNYMDGCSGSWVLIILFALIFGFGGNGFGMNKGTDLGTYATAASQQEILFGQQFQGLDNKIDRIGNGIADATYALNNSINSEGRGIQMQLANCCCENQRNTDALRYDMANMNVSTNANLSAQIQSIKDMISQNKIETLQNQVNTLTMQNTVQAATAGVVKYPMQSTWALTGNPFCSCNCNC